MPAPSAVVKLVAFGRTIGFKGAAIGCGVASAAWGYLSLAGTPQSKDALVFAGILFCVGGVVGACILGAIWFGLAAWAGPPAEEVPPWIDADLEEAWRWGDASPGWPADTRPERRARYPRPLDAVAALADSLETLVRTKGKGLAVPDALAELDRSLEALYIVDFEMARRKRTYGLTARLLARSLEKVAPLFAGSAQKLLPKRIAQLIEDLPDSGDADLAAEGAKLAAVVKRAGLPTSFREAAGPLLAAASGAAASEAAIPWPPGGEPRPGSPFPTPAHAVAALRAAATALESFAGAPVPGVVTLPGGGQYLGALGVLLPLTPGKAVGMKPIYLQLAPEIAQQIARNRLLRSDPTVSSMFGMIVNGLRESGDRELVTAAAVLGKALAR